MLADWPQRDLQAWHSAVAASGGGFSRRGYASSLNPRTRLKYQQGYGRWLGYLCRAGRLDPAISPGARATPANLDGYLEHLLASGNRAYSALGRFAELASALRIIDPTGDHSHVTSPDGVPLRSRLDLQKRTFTIHSPKLLFEWGTGLAHQALSLSGDSRRQVLLRDGLIIAFSAARGLRMRGLLSMTLGDRLFQHPGTGAWRVAMEPADIKNRRAISYAWPEALVPLLERYLAVERVELLNGEFCDHLWLNWGGKPLGEMGLDKIIRRRSATRFGANEAFGVHHFRHCIGTAAPLLAPQHPGLTAGMLAISGRVAREHYDRAEDVAAAAAFHKSLAAERRAVAEEADRLFRDTPGYADIRASAGEPQEEQP